MPSNNNVVPLDQARARARSGDTSGTAALDLLARLFDLAAEDVALPSAVRAEIARLRIPTLRAAQLAPDFLANRSHPARRLLDAIAQAAAGLDETVGADDATVAAIAACVHDVLTDFDADLAPFSAQSTRLQRFVEGRTRAEDEDARRFIQAIVARETADLPRRAAEEEVARRLRARLWVPAPVRAMLCGRWAGALAATLRAEGEGSEAWHALVRTMDDLLWSVEPKASPEGRKRLATMLPALVQSLLEGLRRAETPDDERDAFLSALVDCHAHAVKSGLRGMAPVPEAPAPASPAFARATFAAGDRRIEDIHLVTSTASMDSFDEAVMRLRLGAWVELERGARAAARKRLAWMSPLTGAFLLTGVSPTSMAVTITPEALAEQMRRGEARVVDEAPLVERLLATLIARVAPTQG